MSKTFLIIIMTALFSFLGFSQNFSYKTGKKNMCGNPGDIFACTISFTNTSGSPINIFVDRYQKTTPAYWYSCFCYTQCNSPSRDTITVSIPAFSTDMMVVQFKTDSVNPGFSSGDFAIYQVGFQNDADTFNLSAGTNCNEVGIREENSRNLSVNIYPNPSREILYINCNEKIKEIYIFSLIGEFIEQVSIPDKQFQMIDVIDYKRGSYFLEIQTDQGKFRRLIIKE